MAGYPVVGVSASCTHDPQGVDIYDEEGNLTHYDLGDTVPLSKLISRRYSWLVNRGYLSEDFSETFDDTLISGDLRINGNLGINTAPSSPFHLVSGANLLRFANGGSSVTPQLSLSTSGGKSVGLLAGTTGTAFVYDSTGTFNINTDTKANIDNGTSSGGTARLTMDSSGNTTLTGSLTLAGTAGTKNLSMSAGYAILGTVSIGKSGAGYGTIGYGYRTSASSNVYNYDVSDYASMIDFTNGGFRFRTAPSGTAGNAITYTQRFEVTNGGNADLTGNMTIGGTLGVTGATTLTGNLTVNGATFSHSVTGTATHNIVGTQYSSVSIGAGAGYSAELAFATGSSRRWLFYKTEAAESGSNAGSNFALYTYTDAGAYLSNPLTITRSTGAMILTGDLTINKASAYMTINGTSGAGGSLYLLGIAGSTRSINFYTGAASRWDIRTTSATEFGANAGSDFKIYRYSDAGSAIDAPLSITRSTGDITLASTTEASSSTTGAIKTAGGMGVAKKLYVGSDLSVAGQQLLLTHGNPYVSMHSTHTAPGNRYFTGLYNNASGGELRLHADGGAMTLYVSNSASYPFRIYSSSWNGTSYDITERFKMDGSNGTATISGNLTVTGTTDSSSSITGAVTTAGGMGIAKKLYVGTDANVAGTIEASDVRAISQVMGAF